MQTTRSGDGNSARTRATAGRAYLGTGALVCLGLAGAYHDVARKLVHDWSVNEDYSHGFLIVPMAAYLAWERRGRLQGSPPAPAAAGLLFVLAGIAMLGAGTLGAELFVARTSLLVVLAGIIVFLGGWRHLKILSFPLAFLLLMIPIPMIIFNQLAFPLQLVASRVGQGVLQGLDIPVLRQGNVITLANTTLEVAEACSGIRSLVSLLTLSIVYGYFNERRQSIRVVLALSTLPIAILTNGLRVAAIGVATYYYGPGMAEGLPHTVSGWLVFVLALVFLVGLHHALGLAIRPRAVTAQHPVATA